MLVAESLDESTVARLVTVLGEETEKGLTSVPVWGQWGRKRNNYYTVYAQGFNYHRKIFI